MCLGANKRRTNAYYANKYVLRCVEDASNRFDKAKAIKFNENGSRANFLSVSYRILSIKTEVDLSYYNIILVITQKCILLLGILQLFVMYTNTEKSFC